LCHTHLGNPLQKACSEGCGAIASTRMAYPHPPEARAGVKLTPKHDTHSCSTAMKKLRIVILGFGARNWSLNDGQIQNPPARL
jgi:hypothetical protein